MLKLKKKHSTDHRVIVVSFSSDVLRLQNHQVFTITSSMHHCLDSSQAKGKCLDSDRSLIWCHLNYFQPFWKQSFKNDKHTVKDYAQNLSRKFLSNRNNNYTSLRARKALSLKKIPYGGTSKVCGKTNGIIIFGLMKPRQIYLASIHKNNEEFRSEYKKIVNQGVFNLIV